MGKKKHKYVNPWDDFDINDQLKADDELYDENVSLLDVLDKKDINDKRGKYGLPKSALNLIKREADGFKPSDDYDEEEAAWDTQVNEITGNVPSDNQAIVINSTQQYTPADSYVKISENTSDETIGSLIWDSSVSTIAETKDDMTHDGIFKITSFKSYYGSSYIDATVPLSIPHPYSFTKDEIHKYVQFYIMHPEANEDSYIDEDLNIYTSRLLRGIIASTTPAFVLPEDRYDAIFGGEKAYTSINSDILIFGVENDGLVDVYVVDTYGFTDFFDRFYETYPDINNVYKLPELKDIRKLAYIIGIYKTVKKSSNYLANEDYRQSLLKESLNYDNEFYLNLIESFIDDNGYPIDKYTRSDIISEADTNAEEYAYSGEDDEDDTDTQDDIPVNFEDSDYEEIDEEEDYEEDEDDEDDDDDIEDLTDDSDDDTEEVEDDSEVSEESDEEEISSDDNIDKMLDDSIENLASETKTDLNKNLEPIHKKGNRK